MESVIRLKLVKAISGLSRSTIYRLEKAAKFPKRFKIGERAIGWSSKEIFEWVNKRKNSMDINNITEEANFMEDLIIEEDVKIHAYAEEPSDTL